MPTAVFPGNHMNYIRIRTPDYTEPTAEQRTARMHEIAAPFTVKPQLRIPFYN